MRFSFSVTFLQLETADTNNWCVSGTIIYLNWYYLHGRKRGYLGVVRKAYLQLWLLGAHRGRGLQRQGFPRGTPWRRRHSCQVWPQPVLGSAGGIPQSHSKTCRILTTLSVSVMPDWSAGSKVPTLHRAICSASQRRRAWRRRTQKRRGAWCARIKYRWEKWHCTVLRRAAASCWAVRSTMWLTISRSTLEEWIR